MPRLNTYDAEVVHQTVGVSPDVAYEFARRMENLPRWASGLAAGISEENGQWFADSPMGRVKVKMAPMNPFRVLDHEVTLPNGDSVFNAFRITPAGQGSLLTFAVLRLPGATAEMHRQDVAHVAKDLQTLKQLLEASPSTNSPDV